MLALVILLPSSRGEAKEESTLSGLLCFHTHETGLCNRVKILDFSNFCHVNTSIKNVSQVTVLVSPSSACFSLEV